MSETYKCLQLLSERENHLMHLVWTLTKHDEGGCPLFISSRIGGVLAGIATGVGHSQVRNPDGWVLQTVVKEHNAVLEGHIWETLSIHRVVHSNVVPVSVGGFPYPGHLIRIKNL